MPPPNGGHRHTDSVSQNHKAQLASAYNELGKELSSSKIRVVGNYTLGKAIGEGAYGKVRIGTHRLTGTRVAIKQIPKAMSASLTREIHHHRQLHHPHVTQLYEVIATESNIWLVTELCSGGELFDYLAEKGRLTEDEVRLVFGQLCLAVAYVHEKGIVHRDLKLENVLLDERCRVKLGDFGFTREFERGNLLETFCGTTGYAAPEMLLAKKYLGPEVDVWSLGVILYTLLTGTLPFDDDDDSVMREKVIIGEFEDPEWLSDEVRDLIKKILVIDPNNRLSISQILAHSWFSAPAPPLSAAPSSTFNFAPPSPLPSSSPLPELPPVIEAPPKSVSSVTSDSTFHSASADFPSTPTTPDEGLEDDVFGSPTPHAYATVPHRSSQSTLKSPHLSVQEAPESLPSPETILEEGTTTLSPLSLLDSSALRPSISRSTTVSNLSNSSKNPPTHPARTPARTKRRSISSTLSEPASPTTAAAKTCTLPQDFSSMLHTPSPMIFSTQLERDLLSNLSTLGFDTSQIVHSVLTDACDATGSLWWMLKRKAEKKAVADGGVELSAVGVSENGVKEGSKHASKLKEVRENGDDRDAKPKVTEKSSHEHFKQPATTPSTPPHSPTLTQARSAPELQFIPPTPTAATNVMSQPPTTPPRSKSPSTNQNDRPHTLLSPVSSTSLLDSFAAKSHPSTPSGSLKERDSRDGRDKDKDSQGSKGRKNRAGSVSIMQRATTALEAAGLVRKKSSEAVKEERERERSGEKRSGGSGDEPRGSHGSGSNKAKSPPLRAVKDSAAPGTPPPAVPVTGDGTVASNHIGSPWVLAGLKGSSTSPPSTPASSHGDTLGALPNIQEHGAKMNRQRGSLLSTFRMWFREDPKGKRKATSPPALSTQGLGYTTPGGTSGNSPSASPVNGRGRGTVKRRVSGNRGKVGTVGRRSANRTKRSSMSSRRSSSVNSKRSSLTSTQIAILEASPSPQHVVPPATSADQMTPMTRQRSDPSRRSFGSHTPNSEREEFVSRPSSIQSFHNHHRHRKSPSASSAGSNMQVGRNSPLPKYHRRGGSGSSTTRVVRQVTSSGPGKHQAVAAHLRSNSASSNHSLASSRHNSVYELSETEGRRASSPRKSLSRSSFDDGGASTPRRGGTTTFVAQKRQTPFSHPGGNGYLNSMGRTSWKKSWGREPPGWQTRTAHPSIEVLAILPAVGDTTTNIRDVFTGRTSLSMGDESDWVDEDDDVSDYAYVGGLGQLPISTNSNPLATKTSAYSRDVTDSPMLSPPSARGPFIKPPPLALSTPASSTVIGKRATGGGLGSVNAAGRGPRTKTGGRSPAGRTSPLPNETTFEAAETRGGGRRQLPNGRSGPAFRSEPYDPYLPRNGAGNATPGPSQGNPKTAAIQQQIDDTVGIMRENITKVAERGERLDQLQDKTDNLAVSAQGFRRGANRVRKNMWWKDMKMRIIIGVAIAIIIVIIVVSVVKATK